VVPDHSNRAIERRRPTAQPLAFHLRGEIDLTNADGLITTLRSVAGQQAGDLVVDCTELAFIDAAGIRALNLIRNELAQQRRSMRLVHASPLLTKTLQVLDLSCFLHAQ
jgi:anti-anti-sigma factor